MRLRAHLLRNPNRWGHQMAKMSMAMKLTKRMKAYNNNVIIICIIIVIIIINIDMDINTNIIMIDMNNINTIINNNMSSSSNKKRAREGDEVALQVRLRALQARLLRARDPVRECLRCICAYVYVYVYV